MLLQGLAIAQYRWGLNSFTYVCVDSSRTVLEHLGPQNPSIHIYADSSRTVHCVIYSIITQGTVILYIQVEDYDPYNSNDHIDNVYVTISLTPNSTFTPRQRYCGIYGRSRIELSFRLQCSSADLYGSNCTTFCVARNDNEGHYICGLNGEKICLNGWSEPSNNCTVRKYNTDR